MLDALWTALLCALCLAGLLLAAGLVIVIGVCVARILLWWADYRGTWMDEHPEQEKKK